MRKLLVTQCTKDTQKKAEYQRLLSEMADVKFEPNIDGKEW